MKRSLLVGAILLLHTYARADCDAPGLSFPKHRGTLYGFTVTKLFDEGAVREARGAQHTVIPFGDYHFSFDHASGNAIPQPVRSDPQEASRILGEGFVTGAHPPDGEVRPYSVLATAAFDLDGDLKADLILFDVSPGSNAYSGAVGILGEQWFTVVEPTCY